MNGDAEATFYNVVMLLCAVMAAVNASRTKSRGLSAVFLSLGFVDLGATTMLYSRMGLSWPVYVGVAFLFVCLIGDAVYRIRKQTRGPR